MKKKFLRKLSLMMTAVLVSLSVSTQTVMAENVANSSDEIVYAKDVVTDISTDYQYEETANGTTEVVTTDTDTAENLKEGDIVVLPAQNDTDSERAIEVTSVTETEDGYVIAGQNPEDFFDIVESVDMEGSAATEISEVVVEDGVQTVDVNASKAKSFFAITSTGTTAVDPIGFHIDKSLDASNYITGDITITPSLDYRLRFDLGGVKDLTLIVNNELNVDNLKVSCNQGGVLPIATLPYTFGDGMFTVYVNLNLVYSAQGDVYLSYAMNGYYGVSYDGKTTNFKYGYEPDIFTYGISAEGKAGVQVQMGLIAMGTYSLMDTELNAGVAAEVDKTSVTPGSACVYFYMDGKYGYSSILSQYGVCGSKQIYNADNSPLKYAVNF